MNLIEIGAQTQIALGRCETHGLVMARRQIPKPHFPLAICAIKRVLAERQPYRCPVCSAAVVLAQAASAHPSAAWGGEICRV
jgi:hypothetical protein